MFCRKDNCFEKNALYFMLGTASTALMVIGCCLSKKLKSKCEDSEHDYLCDCDYGYDCDCPDDTTITHRKRLAYKLRSKNLINQIYRRAHKNNYQYKLRRRSYVNWHEKPQ